MLLYLCVRGLAQHAQLRAPETCRLFLHPVQVRPHNACHKGAVLHDPVFELHLTIVCVDELVEATERVLDPQKRQRPANWPEVDRAALLGHCLQKAACVAAAVCTSEFQHAVTNQGHRLRRGLQSLRDPVPVMEEAPAIRIPSALLMRC